MERDEAQEKMNALKRPTRAKKHKTAADKKRFEALVKLGCICCRISARGYVYPQIHHIETKMGKRKNHARTIPLCLNHHQSGHSSIHGHRSYFEFFYGTESELLAKVNKLLEQAL